MLYRQTIINQQLEQMNTNNRMISSVSSDLKVIGTYLQTSLEPKVQPRNLSQLSSLVKNRLSEKLVSKQKKSTCREWLQSRGMQIQPLLQYIASRKKKEKDQDKVNKKQDSFGIPVLQPTLFNHQEYSQKALQYASTNILTYLQTNRTISKRHFKNTMSKLRCQSIDSTQNHFSQSSYTSFARNQQKRNIYIKTVKKLLDYELQSKKQKGQFESIRQEQSDKVAKLFYQNVSLKLWAILYRQVKNVDFSRRKETIMTEMLVNSLKIVEEQYSQDLPLNKQAISYYLQQKFLNQIERNAQYEFDQEHGSIWGKAFLYFRAGRMKEVASLLQNVNQKQLVKQIALNFESILKKNPKKVIINPFLTRPVQDIFRDQILFAIGGQRKYSSQILADTSTLDCVWVLLRNTGIYYQTDSDLFEQMKSQMVEYYKQTNQQKQQIYNCAYLVDYESILKMSENQTIDKDDVLHLLIVMLRYPCLVKQKPYIQQKLTDLAISYAVELAQEKREELVYYILMIPQEKIVEEASSIIAGNRLYLGFNWEAMKKYLKPSIFQKLVSQSSKKFVISTRNYLQAATNLLDQINDKETSLNLLAEMFVLHFEQKKIYNQQEISKALNFNSWLVKQNPQLGKRYFQLNQLFDALNALSKASRSRNYRTIEDLIKKSQLILGENIDYYNSNMLDKLKQLNGLDVYFIFLTNISRAADYVYNVEDEQQLKKFNYLLFRTANTIINHQKYKEVCFQQSIIKLIEELSEKVMGNAIEDYKSYY